MEHQAFSPLVDWGVAAAALPGQVVSGDRCVVAPFPNGVLAAVVDGLGHGDQAARAAEAAAAALEAHASESIVALTRRCHDALVRTRGAVLTLAAFDSTADTLTWLGVGNVEGILLHVATPTLRDFVLLRGGVAGYQLPPLRASVLSLARGDTLILATDGIRSGFTDNLVPTDSPQQMADHILTSCNKGIDDALVLVVRYLGGAS